MLVRYKIFALHVPRQTNCIEYGTKTKGTLKAGSGRRGGGHLLISLLYMYMYMYRGQNKIEYNIKILEY